MTDERKALTDTLLDAPSAPPTGSGLDLFDEFESPDEGVLPRGVYAAVAVSGKLTASARGTDVYRIGFRITEGEYAGRTLYKPCYLSPAALKISKPLLKKVGLDTLLKLKSPFQAERHLCKVQVVVTKDDHGFERNEVRDFLVTGEQEPPQDPFAPADAADAGGSR